MQGLTNEGHNAVSEIANRYQLSFDAVSNMLLAVNNGGGSMAQFYIPELGGGGQWMQGGMTMVGDMFNHGLKSTVDALCCELSNLLANTQVYKPLPRDKNGFSAGANNWWPSELGNVTASGGQNNMRYAYFAGSQRLVVDNNGAISVYDTLDHNIGGVQQQQGGSDSVSFTSQYGTITTLNLPLISGPGAPSQAPAPAPTPLPQEVPQASAPQPESIPPQPQERTSQVNPDTDAIISNIQKLSELCKAGILNEQEFETKKNELLSRI